jgi:RNA polymerase sigma-70 factor (ECF subfamily)
VTVTTLADEFQAHRAHLLAVGYRLTGSVSDAEDAIQESWLRLAATDPDEIRDLRAWLTTVVSRLCLDRLRSAAVRRENYIGQWLPEPIVFGLSSSGDDPLEAVVHDEDSRFAAMVVLDTLTPPQRVAFVLHDGFSVPFDEIAEILGVAPATARQLASRARKAVARAPEPVPDDEHAAAVDALISALGKGDVQAVVAALHPEAMLVGDGGGATRMALNVVAGADRVARFFVGLIRKFGVELVQGMLVSFNGQLGVIVPPGDDRPVHVVGFAVRDGKVWAAYDVANPAKLRGLRAVLDDNRPSE